ncbi:Hsp70 family protein [Microbacterium enclense]|uniref:Hsp70 family protein n=1 Tax=Microbacterium enclense TaxID=993073 RepID=UPI0036D7A970
MATPLPLGRNADSTPTTVFVSDSGLLFGDAAERRGTAQPERLVREFKRRIGDDVPIVAADRRFSPQDLYALVVGWVIGTAVEREGQHPAGIAVSVPVTWGEYRTRLVQDSIGRLGWNDVHVITEPEAAARHYESTHPLESGRALAVYDFGGGTFDTVILQKSRDGHVDFVGAPVGISDLGGADFDDIVLRHTVRTAGLPAATMAAAATDPGLRMALASLRRECVEAKESLSFDGEAVVPVLVGDGHGAVRLTRAEFEDMIEPEIERTIEVLETALEQSGLTAEDLDAILLTGGTSRIPRVAQLLSERFDRPIAVDADPKAIIALGAARVAADDARGPLAAVTDDEVDDDAEEDDDPIAAAGFRPTRAEKRAPWFRRVPATAYVAAGVTALAVGVGFVSVPALGAGILARSDAEMTSQPLAEDREDSMFLPFDQPSETPENIADPGLEPVAAQEPAAPQQEAAPERSSGASNPRARAQQRQAPKTNEKRSSASPVAPVNQAAPPPASGGGNGGGGGGGGGQQGGGSTGGQGGSSTAPTTGNSSSPTTPTDTETGTTDPGTTSPSPSDPGTTSPSPSDPGTTSPSPSDPGTTSPSPSDPPPTTPAETQPPVTEEPQPEPPAETTQPPAETSTPDPGSTEPVG